MCPPCTVVRRSNKIAIAKWSPRNAKVVCRATCILIEEDFDRETLFVVIINISRILLMEKGCACRRGSPLPSVAPNGASHEPATGRAAAARKTSPMNRAARRAGRWRTLRAPAHTRVLVTPAAPNRGGQGRKKNRRSTVNFQRHERGLCKNRAVSLH